jgi:hypothetical protein
MRERLKVAVTAFERIEQVHEMYCESHVGVGTHSHDLYHIAWQARVQIGDVD